MQVMPLKIRELPLSIGDAICYRFCGVKASKAYLNDAGDAAQNLGTYNLLPLSQGEGKQGNDAGDAAMMQLILAFLGAGKQGKSQ